MDRVGFLLQDCSFFVEGRQFVAEYKLPPTSTISVLLSSASKLRSITPSGSTTRKVQRNWGEVYDDELVGPN